ncbi:CDP-glucose 4,6-dehydratase [bacterium]|nr:CDP-glucose 4,6-dehydratase [bacterium]
MYDNSYKNKRVLVTGHTGFKGSWLVLWLKKLGAEVCGYALEPYTNPSMYEALNINTIIDKSVTGNILNSDNLEKTFSDFKPDIVFHLAAQPLVRLSYSQPKLTYETNVLGALNVLEAARKTKSVKAFVNVTTDKCYENKEIKKGYKEDDPMGGYDMYSSSKACVEIMSSSYRRCFLQNEDSFAMATARAGNVIGGGDWAEDRLIPDCIRSITSGKDIEIRCPNSVRPWQHVLEPLSGYLLLGQKLLVSGKEYADCFNFGPDEKSILTVSDIVRKVCAFYGKGNVITVDKSELHESGILMLSVEKANKVLGWRPTLSVEEAVKNTVDWYKMFYEHKSDLSDFTISQIDMYEQKINWDNKL